MNALASAVLLALAATPLEDAERAFSNAAAAANEQARSMVSEGRYEEAAKVLRGFVAGPGATPPSEKVAYHVKSAQEAAKTAEAWAALQAKRDPASIRALVKALIAGDYHFSEPTTRPFARFAALLPDLAKAEPKTGEFYARGVKVSLEATGWENALASTFHAAVVEELKAIGFAAHKKFGADELKLAVSACGSVTKGEQAGGRIDSCKLAGSASWTSKGAPVWSNLDVGMPVRSLIGPVVLDDVVSKRFAHQIALKVLARCLEMPPAK